MASFLTLVKVYSCMNCKDIKVDRFESDSDDILRISFTDTTTGFYIENKIYVYEADVLFMRYGFNVGNVTFTKRAIEYLIVCGFNMLKIGEFEDKNRNHKLTIVDN